jgi:ribosome biogenesis GTPase
MDLTTLGWCPFFADAFAALQKPDWQAARVVGEDKHSFTVVGMDGDLPAAIPGKLFHRRNSNADLPKVGDWVAVSSLPGERKVVIQTVLPRRSKLGRKTSGREAEEQILAANIDTAFIVQALDASFNLRRLERFLVMAHEGGTRPVVVLNKADLCDDPDARLAKARLSARDTPVVVVSAKTRKGIGHLREFVKSGETICFVGTSGVGKSTLINRLYGEELQDTIEVREKDAKGRHTTTWREIIPLPGGALVIDTPGMREFHLWHAEDGLNEAFPDVAAIAVNCHFRDCSHTHEAECAVKREVEAGQFPRDRYQSYLKLHAEQIEVRREEVQHVRTVQHKKAHLSRVKHGYEDDDGEE